MRQELQMRHRALHESITRASGDAELISDLQVRLRESESQCHSLQSGFQERANEKAAKDNTLRSLNVLLKKEIVARKIK